MRKLFLSIAAFCGLATITATAAEFVWKDIQTNVSTPLYQNRTALNQSVVKAAKEYLDTIEAVNDWQKLNVIRYKVVVYDQTSGADRSLAGLKNYADDLIAGTEFEKPLSGVQYVSLFNIWWRQGELEFAQAVYGLIKSTPGAEAHGDSGLWANAIGKYAEAYDLYLASETWPQRAMSIAINRLNDLPKAFAAAQKITGKTYNARVVQEVITMTISKLAGSDAVPAADMKTFLQNVNRKYSSQLIVDKATWEPIIAQVRTMLETY